VLGNGNGLCLKKRAAESEKHQGLLGTDLGTRTLVTVEDSPIEERGRSETGKTQT